MALKRLRVGLDEVVAQPTPATRSIRQRPAELLAVAALVLAAVAIRIQGFPSGGPVAYDEGWAVTNGRFLAALITHPGAMLHGHFFVFGRDWKVSHDLALGSLLAAGVRPENLTWFSTLAGIVMAIVLAALAWRRWGAPAGAVAGVIGAAAPLSVLYGHMLLAEADGLAALTIALALLDRCWDGRPSARLAALTVLTMLAALSFNYRLLPTLLPLVLVAGWLAWWYRNHDLRPRVPSGWLLAACVLPAAAIAALDLAALGLDALGIRRLSAMLHHLIRTSSGASLPFANLDFYPRTLWEFAGPALVIATIAALAVLLWQRRQLDPLAAISAGSLIGSLLFFTAVGDKAPRAIAVCLPFAALVIARAVTTLGISLPHLSGTVREGAAQWALALGVSLACLISGLGATTGRGLSGTGEAGRWLATHPGGIVATRAPIFVAYAETRWDPVRGLDPAHAIVPAPAGSTASSLRQAGARYVVVDAHALLLGDSTVFRQLLACGAPAASFPDVADWSKLQFLEEADTLHRGYDATLALRGQLLSASGGAQTIRIYDLEGSGVSRC